ncbi:MAG: shikimate kinase [Oscillospiraceae bacterium]|nr:shikimate kinase [Oscillospiraceae bacterium]
MSDMKETTPKKSSARVRAGGTKKVRSATTADGTKKPKVKVIFLSGFMGSGKTAAGELAAKKAKVPFVDLDTEIAKTANMTIPELFAQGEAVFRKVESVTLSLIIAATSMIKEKTLIVALGGGTIIDPKNAQSINEFGVSVFIDVDFEPCYDRIKDDPNRPVVSARTREQLEALYLKRQPQYLQNSQHIIDGNCSLDDLAERIAKIAKPAPRKKPVPKTPVTEGEKALAAAEETAAKIKKVTAKKPATKKPTAKKTEKSNDSL